MLGVAEKSHGLSMSSLYKRDSRFQIYLFSKVVLFHIEISQTRSALCCALGSVGKVLMSRGALTWFETVSSYIVEAIDH